MSLSIEHQVLRVSLYQFSYAVAGDSRNPPLLFLHGFLGDSREFDAAFERLAGQFYCLALDLPGHGQTQVMGEDLHYGMASVAQGLIQFLEALQMRHWGLVGYSMGGRLALYLALQFPAYFDRVILESASPGLQDQVARDRRFTHDLNLAQKLETSSLEDFTQFLRDWYNQPLFASLKNHPYFQAIFDRRLDNQPLELAKALRGLSVGVQPSLWDQLAKNQLPIVLLVGALDLKFVTIAQAMVESGQNLQLQIIQNCGHSIHLEKAELFAEQIRRFWV